MKHWIRFHHNEAVGFGTVANGEITVHSGDMFNGARANGEKLALADVRLL